MIVEIGLYLLGLLKNPYYEIMKWFIALLSLVCIFVISLGYIMATRTTSTGFRMVPLHRQYNTRVESGYWEKGVSSAKVELAEYADFQSPSCRNYYMMLAEVLPQSKDFISYRYYHYPLTMNDKSTLAARAAEAAGRQGKFWEMYDLLYARQLDWARLSVNDFSREVEKYAQETLALNMEQFRQDLGDPGLQALIDRDVNKGNQIGFMAVPAMTINGQIINNMPTSAEELLTLLRQAAGM